MMLQERESWFTEPKHNHLQNLCKTSEGESTMSVQGSFITKQGKELTKFLWGWAFQSFEYLLHFCEDSSSLFCHTQLCDLWFQCIVRKNNAYWSMSKWKLWNYELCWRKHRSFQQMFWFAYGKISVPSDSLHQWENISLLVFHRREYKTVILGTSCWYFRKLETPEEFRRAVI